MGKKEKKRRSVTAEGKELLLRGFAENLGGHLEDWSDLALVGGLLAVIALECVIPFTPLKFVPGIEVLIFGTFGMALVDEVVKRGGRKVLLDGVRKRYLGWLGERHIALRWTALLTVIGVETLLSIFHIDLIPVLDTVVMCSIGIPLLDSVMTHHLGKRPLTLAEKSRGLVEEIWPVLDAVLKKPLEELDELSEDGLVRVRIEQIHLEGEAGLTEDQLSALETLTGRLRELSDWEDVDYERDEQTGYVEIVFGPSRQKLLKLEGFEGPRLAKL